MLRNNPAQSRGKLRINTDIMLNKNPSFTPPRTPLEKKHIRGNPPISKIIIFQLNFGIRILFY